MNPLNRINFAVLLTFIYGTCGVAQTSRDLDVADPALLEKRLEEKSQLPQSEMILPKKKALPVAPAGKQASGVKFLMKKVVFTKGTVFSDSALQEVARPYLNKSITLKDLYVFAAKISKLYQDKGYILSRAVVPPQEIGKDGSVKIQLVEGYVDSISYEGKASGISSRAKSYAEKIKSSMPLNAKDLERYLLLMKDLPGLEVETVLKPSSAHPQASHLIIMAKRKHLEGSVGANNFGNKYIGPHMFNATGGANSILGIDDKFFVHAAVTGKTREMRHGMVGYDQIVGTEGTKIGVSGSMTQTRPAGPIASFEIYAETKTLNFSLSHPVLRSRSQSFYAGSSLTIRNGRKRDIPFGKSEERLRVLGFNFTWDRADKWAGVNLVNVEFNQGIHGFGAKLKTERDHARLGFSKVTADFSRLQGLWGNFSLFGLVNYQKAFSYLPGSERFSYGGSSHFRGYTDNPLTGDTGLKERIELRYGADRGAAYKNPLLSFYQLYGFFSAGTAWNIKPEPKDRRRTTAREFGGGVRLAFFKNTNFSLEAVRPLKRSVQGRKNRERVFFSLTQKF